MPVPGPYRQPVPTIDDIHEAGIGSPDNAPFGLKFCGVGAGKAPTQPPVPMSDVSVIIPTFNRARMLEECVASLLQQTRPPFEILIVDDGSTDDTAEVAQRMPALVRYLNKRNAGKPAALNFAIPHARGSWIWFFDDDDVALPRSIEARLHAAEQTPGAQIVISRFLWGTNDSAGRLGWATRCSGQRLRPRTSTRSSCAPALLTSTA